MDNKIFLNPFFKCDLNKEGLANNQTHMDEFCRDKGFIGWYETSAKENINVEQASKFLVSKIIEKENIIKKLEEQQENDKLQLTNTLVPPPKSKCC
jgi:Ras-related protein Rab-32